MTTVGRLERVSLDLRELYQRHGYRQYKVSKFEEYDLYAQNRSFLGGERILTFSDTDGRLMALKPDVTMSVIKNTRDDERLRKVWYSENVYRADRGGYGFQEIMQTGLECVGPIDLYAMSEVVMLAAESLAGVSSAYVLDISHLGLLTGVLDAAGADASAAQAVIAAAGAKNLHALRDAAQKLPAPAADLLEKLCLLSGRADAVLPELLALPLPPAAMDAARELQDLCGVLRVFGAYNINIDLSVTNDTDYYNGLIFRGFVDGAHACVLSGGRYDHLVNRMGKTGGAIGFAVYLSALELMLYEKPAYDVDTLLLYDEDDDPAAVAAAMKRLTGGGETVRAQLRGEPAVTCRRQITLSGGEASV